MKRAAFALAAALCLGGTDMAVAGDYIGGDSMGLGAQAVSGLPGFAKSSSGIFNGLVLRQLKSVPNGSRLFLFLGTNDAVGLTEPMPERFDSLVKAMKAKELDVVWVGPPCVLQAWNANIPEFDKNLGAMVRESGFVYVSLRDFPACRLPRLADGVHFNFAGYVAMWKFVSAPEIKQRPEVSARLQGRPAPRAKDGPAPR